MTHTSSHAPTQTHTHTMANGLGAVTNTVIPLGLGPLGAIQRHYEPAQFRHFLPRARPEMCRQYHWCGAGTRTPTWTPPGHDTVDGMYFFSS